MAKSDDRVRQLRETAAEQVEKGKYEKALQLYIELEQLEPQDAAWSRKVADCHRRLGRREDELRALLRAASSYSRQGFLVKAVAVCKVALAIDGSNVEALARLAQLHEAVSGPSDSRALVAGAEPAGSVRTAPAVAPPAPAKAETRSGGFANRLRQVASRLRAAKRPERSEPSAAEPNRLQPQAELTTAGQLNKTPPFEPVLASLGSVSVPPAYAANAALDAAPLSQLVPGSARVTLADATQAPIYELSLDEVEIATDEAMSSKPAETRAPVEEPAVHAAANAAGAGERSQPDLVEYEAAELEAEPSPSRQRAQRALDTTPLFSEVSPETLQKLIERVGLVRLEPDEVLFREGEHADAMYVIASGEMAVWKQGDHSPIELGTLVDGDFFGEVGLLSDQPRQATLRAVRETELLVFERSVITQLINEEPPFLKVLLRFVRDRLIGNLVRTSPLFAAFESAERAALCEQFKFIEAAAGSVLVQQGQRSDGLFVLLSGKATALCNDAGGQRELGALGPGDVFGEMSLLGQGLAVATVTCKVRSYALFLPARQFRELIMTHPSVLEYVSVLAEERRAHFAALSEAPAGYHESILQLV